MFRLLLLCFLLRTTATSENGEGSADIGDDEDGYAISSKEDTISRKTDTNRLNTDKATGNGDGSSGFTTVIIIGAVSVVALAVGVTAAVFLVKRHMAHQQRGNYGKPAEQSQKV